MQCRMNAAIMVSAVEKECDWCRQACFRVEEYSLVIRLTWCSKERLLSRITS